MKKKKVLRKIFLLLFCFAFFQLIVHFVDITSNVLAKVVLFISLFVLLFILFLIILILLISFIFFEVQKYKNYKIYIRLFEDLKNIHKKRYKLYFTGNNELIELYTKTIQRCGNFLVTSGNECIAKKLLTKKQCAKIQEMCNKTKQLLENEYPTD